MPGKLILLIAGIFCTVFMYAMLCRMETQSNYPPSDKLDCFQHDVAFVLFIDKSGYALPLPREKDFDNIVIAFSDGNVLIKSGQNLEQQQDSVSLHDSTDMGDGDYLLFKTTEENIRKCQLMIKENFSCDKQTSQCIGYYGVDCPHLRLHLFMDGTVTVIRHPLDQSGAIFPEKVSGTDQFQDQTSQESKFEDSWQNAMRILLEFCQSGTNAVVPVKLKNQQWQNEQIMETKYEVLKSDVLSVTILDTSNQIRLKKRLPVHFELLVWPND